GMRAIGAIMGILTLGWRTGAALGPATAGFLYDATGSDTPPFGAAARAGLGGRVFFAPGPSPRARDLKGDLFVDCCAHEGPGGGDARFDFQKVADGVWAAVASPAYKVNCNTAIIENDDGLMVVDTHSKPSAARVIVERLRQMSTKPVRYVVNTHFHWDHWHGNEVYPQAYPDAEIVTNTITREAMVKKGLKRIQDHVRQVPAEIKKLESDIQAS